jgi:hypothetical protein
MKERPTGRTRDRMAKKFMPDDLASIGAHDLFD